MVVPDVWGVQVEPFGDVRMVPEFPTATNWDPDHVMPKRVLVVPDVWGVQVEPFGDVRMVPEFPTTTNREREADQAAPFRELPVPDI